MSNVLLEAIVGLNKASLPSHFRNMDGAILIEIIMTLTIHLKEMTFGVSVARIAI